MHKWQLLSIVGLSCISLGGPAFASDTNALLPTNDTQGCSALIQQGDVDPPVPTNDLHTLQTCRDSCDLLYKSLGDQGRVEDMLRGSSYCRKSLNNLYFSSVAQTINDQLNQKTQQQQAEQQQAFLEKVSAMIKAKQDQPANGGDPNATSPPAKTPAAAQPPLSGPPDNVNW